MMKKYLQAMAVLLLAVVCAACTTVASTPKPPAQTHASVATVRQLVVQSMTALHANPDDKAARAELDKAIHAKGFDQLPVQLRFPSLMAASAIARENSQYKKAHKLAVRATAFPTAGYTAWTIRLHTALDTDNYKDAGHSLTIIAVRWPAKLDAVKHDMVGRIQHHLRKAHDADVDRKMLDALFNAGWLAAGSEPSYLWKHLILLDLRHGDTARAATIATRITSARTALSMLVDKRFDPITSQGPAAFNVGNLLAAQINAATARMQAHPHQLDAVANLQVLYLADRQAHRVLTVSNAAVATAQKGNGEQKYTDFDNQYNWVLDTRSRAWGRMGKWKQAVHAEVLAARQLEQGETNVSQRINLATLYANLKQPDQAANAILGLTRMTGYGRMQLEMVKLKIAVEKHDNADIKTAMAYLREHQTDAIGAWERALVYRNKLGAAATLLIKRLQNPRQRNAALVDMQRYAKITESPVVALIAKRWNTVTARADVQAALHKVGRLESFPITSPMH